MQKIVIEQNIKTLIKSNLLNLEIIDKSSKFKKLNTQILDPLVFIRNIKQFIRLLQFLKNQQKSLLYIDLHDNDVFATLVSTILLKKKKTKIHLVNQSVNKHKIKKLKKISKLYLYVNPNSFNSNFFKFLFFNKMYMVYSFNLDSSNNGHLGYYKFYTNLNEIKKIFFFSILLKKYL